MEPFHLHRYLDEQMFRYNNRKDENGRKLSDAERFTLALIADRGEAGLTFAEVTGKVDETPFLIFGVGSAGGGRPFLLSAGFACFSASRLGLDFPNAERLQVSA